MDAHTSLNWNSCERAEGFSQNQKLRCREIAKKLGPLGLTWSHTSRVNLDYDRIKSVKDNGLRLFLLGYRRSNDVSAIE